ncbi:TonB-dependent receptor [Hoylesella saccharolytica]|uniref:SusC/RagA family TonB-linked outer membrane protein n=1 Tax=Hoylesella saccharolytica TaxID=633701 RepID=UPI0028EFFEF8|nr:TonB-dependent receptor [Hoylesella saccharolytica]
MKRNIVLYRMCLLLLVVTCISVSGRALSNTVFALQQQRLSVLGVVVDESGEGLIGASVAEVGTNNRAVTDLNGRFTLSVTPHAALEFKYVGYETLKISASKDMHVVLKAEQTNLNEVVVVGYGTQKKVSVIGSVAAIDNKELLKSSAPNLSAALSGKLPGLTTIQTSGEPGRDNVVMFLRGAATSNGTSPLVMVDGIPVDNMSAISPHEIASISVLKDASATAVFGVRGANGVIMITTRKGEKGSVKINTNVEYSIQSVAFKPERLDAWDWVRLRNEALINDGNAAEFKTEDIAKYDSWRNGMPTDPDFFPNNNWQKILFRDNAPMVKTNLNVSGGSDKLQYFISAGYLHQGGLFNVESKARLGYNAQSTLDRYNFRSNIDYKINKTIKATLNASSYLERINGTSVAMGNVFHSALTSRPTSVYLTPKNAFATDAIRTFPIQEGLSVEDPANNSLTAYPLINRSGYKLETRSGINLIGGLEADLGFLTKGFSAKGQVSFDSKGFGNTIGSRSYTWYTYQTLPSGKHLFINRHPSLEDEDGPIALTKSSTSYWVMNLQAQLNYDRSFNKLHNVTAMLLAQRDIRESEATSGDLLLPYNVIGIAGRVTYDFNRRYFGEVNIGYNGSEQFSPDKRFGFFPAASIGWVVTNEKFLQDNPVLTNLKIRASFGKVGNDAFGSARFLYLDNINLYSVLTDTKGDHWLSPSLGYQSNGSGWGQGYKINEKYIGNRNITWETAKKQNYGIDLSLYNELSLSFDYFIENRENILIVPNTIPMLQGVPSSALPLINNGKVKNWGFELSAGYQKLFRNELSISANANFSYARNKVLEFDEPLLGKDYAYRTRTTGYSLGQNWGYLIDRSYDPDTGRDGTGFFYSDESITKSGLRYEGVGTPKPGDFIYKDLNGDGIINDRDKAPIGYSSLLPRINYGISISASWKGFDFSLMLQGVGKYSKTYSGAGIYESSGNFYQMHTQRWNKERYQNGENISYPRLSSSGGPSLQPNDFFIMDASYLRLKNIEIGYTLPENLCKSIGSTGIRFYLSGNNLYTWTHLKTKSFDPEQNGTTVYPTMRTYNIGLNITF